MNECLKVSNLKILSDKRRNEMQLREFLEVCRDSNITIYDRKNNPLICGSMYSDVFPFLNYKVLNISTRGCNNICITIDYRSDIGSMQ